LVLAISTYPGVTEADQPFFSNCPVARPHIKVNPRKKGATEASGESLTGKGLLREASSGEEMGGGADDLLAEQAP